jgi:hypothetical protein
METAALDPHVRDLFVGSSHAESMGGLDRFAAAIGRRLGLRRPDRPDARERLLGRIEHRWALPAHLDRGLDVVDADGLEGWSRAWSTRDGYESIELGDRHAFVVPVEPAEQPMALSALDAQRLQPRTRMSPRSTVRPERAQARNAGVRERWRATRSGALSPYPTALGNAGQITPSLLRFPDARAVAGRGDAQLIAVDRNAVPVRNPMVPTARLSAGLAAEALADAATGRAQRFLESPAPVTLWLTPRRASALGRDTAPAVRPAPVAALRSLRSAHATTFLARAQQALDADRRPSNDAGLRPGYDDPGFDAERAMIEPQRIDAPTFVGPQGPGESGTGPRSPTRTSAADAQLPRATTAALQVERAASARLESASSTARVAPTSAARAGNPQDAVPQSFVGSAGRETPSPGEPALWGTLTGADRSPAVSNLAANAPETVFVRPISPWNPAPLEVQTPDARTARATPLRRGPERSTALQDAARRVDTANASRRATHPEPGAFVDDARSARRPTLLASQGASGLVRAVPSELGSSAHTSQRDTSRSRPHFEARLGARALFAPTTAPTQVESRLPTNPLLRQSGPHALAPASVGPPVARAETRLESFLAALGGPQLLEALDLRVTDSIVAPEDHLGTRHDLSRESTLADALGTERVVVVPSSATEPPADATAHIPMEAARGKPSLAGQKTAQAGPRRVSADRDLANPAPRTRSPRPDAARALLRAAPLAASALRHPERVPSASPSTRIGRSSNGETVSVLAAAPGGRPSQPSRRVPANIGAPRTTETARATPGVETSAPRVEAPQLALDTALRSARGRRSETLTPRADHRGLGPSPALADSAQSPRSSGLSLPADSAPDSMPTSLALEPWSPASAFDRWLVGADRLVAWARHLDFGSTESGAAFRLTALPGLTLLAPWSPAPAGGSVSTTASGEAVTRAPRLGTRTGAELPALARRLGLLETQGDGAVSLRAAGSALATDSPERTVVAGSAASQVADGTRSLASSVTPERGVQRRGPSRTVTTESSRAPIVAERLVALAGRIAARTGVSLEAALTLVDRYETVARPHALAAGFEALTSLVAAGAPGARSASLSPERRGETRRDFRSERSPARLRASAPPEARTGGRLGGVVLPELVRRLAHAELQNDPGIGGQLGASPASTRPIGELNARHALVAFERAEAQGLSIDRSARASGVPSAMQGTTSRDAGSIPEVVRPSGGASSAPTEVVAGGSRGGRTSALADTAPTALLVTPPTLSGRLFGDRGPAVTVRTGASSPAGGGHGRVMVETAVARRAAEAALRSTPGERPGQRTETGEEARHRLGGDQIDENLSPEEVEKIAFEVIMQLKQALELDATRIGEDEWD